jgi:hypothetical protein
MNVNVVLLIAHPIKIYKNHWINWKFVQLYWLEMNDHDESQYDHETNLTKHIDYSINNEIVHIPPAFLDRNWNAKIECCRYLLFEHT